ncbi:MAG: protein kinase [Anaerolineae bacterium]|nr:protein kinase [Anaerolineae bacterium]
MERSPVGDTHVLNGRYKLLERVGSGGMAAVYKSEDLVLGRIVAIKLLHLSLTDDAEFLKRFQKEAHAAANLSHPNIVTVHDIGQDGDRYYIVMEFVEGATLKQIIRRQAAEERLLPIDRSLDLMMQMCSGIGYAHRSGLVHCDVKPHNILVSQDDHVKVADFGIARAMTETTLTHQDQVWGTPQYFSPEQAAGRTPTPASDVYSLGVILFEMLTNQLPFEAENHAAMALQHIQAVPPSIALYNPAAPKQLDQIVQKVLSKEPAQRYRTAGQFGRILQSYRLNNRHTMIGVATAAVIANSAESIAVPPPTQDEAPTVDYQQPAVQSTTTTANPQPASLPETGASSVDDPDWIAILLGIVAFIALIGLIPLWYAVYLAWQ